MGPEMAQNWPSGASPVTDIDFRTTIVKATLIPNIKWTLVVQSTPFWTMYLAENGRKMQKLGHLEHLQFQILILGQILLKTTLICNIKWKLGHPVEFKIILALF